jgi:hypothetical protein
VIEKEEILPQQGLSWWFFSSWQLEVQLETGLFSIVALKKIGSIVAYLAIS